MCVNYFQVSIFMHKNKIVNNFGVYQIISQFMVFELFCEIFTK